MQPILRREIPQGFSFIGRLGEVDPPHLGLTRDLLEVVRGEPRHPAVDEERFGQVGRQIHVGHNGADHPVDVDRQAHAANPLEEVPDEDRLTFSHNPFCGVRPGDVLAGIRAWFDSQTADGYLAKVFEVANLDYAIMTNNPFKSEEVDCWDKDLPRPEVLKTALRIDDLLVNWPAAAKVMRKAGYQTTAKCDKASRKEARRYIGDWVERLQPVYMAASLGPDFSYPAKHDSTKVLDDVLVPVAIADGLPITLMTGVKKAMNPALGDGGDAVGTADVDAVANLCATYPDAKFICTMLSRVNQHELTVVARKFGNLHVEGCWWFCNNPSIIDEMTRMRLELLGTAFTCQHSDARVLDQLIYKWAHTRELVADVLAEKYRDLFNAGWRPTTEEVTRDIRAIFGGSFEAFLAK